ncbi:uncharacterized protein LOC144370869 [Ictidomys tridecemlineatus]
MEQVSLEAGAANLGGSGLCSLPRAGQEDRALSDGGRERTVLGAPSPPCAHQWSSLWISLLTGGYLGVSPHLSTSFPILRRDQGLVHAVHQVYCHSQWAAGEGDNSHTPPCQRWPWATGHYSHTSHPEGHVLTGSSCTSPPPPRRPRHPCTHSPWHTSHIPQGSRSSSLRTKWGCSSDVSHLSPAEEGEGDRCWEAPGFLKSGLQGRGWTRGAVLHPQLPDGIFWELAKTSHRNPTASVSGPLYFNFCLQDSPAHNVHLFIILHILLKCHLLQEVSTPAAARHPLLGLGTPWNSWILSRYFLPVGDGTSLQQTEVPEHGN